jgi:A/G-specific adenine glycosylase
MGRTVLERLESARRRAYSSFFAPWYRQNARSFPWRCAGVSPFQLLIAEILLRQTRASSVAMIWGDLASRYPAPALMAKASKEELSPLLRRLGFGAQRVSALRAASSWLEAHHNGEVPDTLPALMNVPHVGPYAANALLCFAYGRRVAIVDTNILRLLSRFYGIEVKPDIRRNVAAWRLAQRSLPRASRRNDSPMVVQEHNYGLLDFAAMVCKARGPRCGQCPLAALCAQNLRALEPSATQLST